MTDFLHDEHCFTIALLRGVAACWHVGRHSFVQAAPPEAIRGEAFLSLRNVGRLTGTS